MRVLPVADDRSSSGGATIRYLLPVCGLRHICQQSLRGRLVAMRPFASINVAVSFVTVVLYRCVYTQLKT